MRHVRRRRKGGGTKKAARGERVHTGRRFAERFGIKLGPDEARLIVNQIQSAKSRVIESQGRNRVLHRIELRGDFYTVVYDSKTKQIVTVLPCNPLLPRELSQLKQKR